ncbi:hypothetical protein [Planobacterium oryzisoli]|uniref:Lysozyme inhibitor n=1 Tax=Planobacterium oryzisoli TaxID=2771435 RepID=A0A931ECD6_9FLAO|nr:hypothetical protein [Planobacterium oryzisoli]MBF5027954.1 hypothetical protein [Planobacterium oryzisoli]
MKKILLAASAFLVLVACTKTEAESTAATEATEEEVKVTDPNEVSNVQEPKTFRSETGDVLKVTYFALGDRVAVKVQKNQEPEVELKGQTVSSSGNLLFGTKDLSWEMDDSGSSGKLTGADGVAVQYVLE